MSSPIRQSEQLRKVWGRRAKGGGRFEISMPEVSAGEGQQFTLPDSHAGSRMLSQQLTKTELAAPRFSVLNDHRSCWAAGNGFQKFPWAEGVENTTLVFPFSCESAHFYGASASSRASTFKAAASCICGRTCEYTFRVKATLAWPSCSLITFGDTPALSERLAAT